LVSTGDRLSEYGTYTTAKAVFSVKRPRHLYRETATERESDSETETERESDRATETERET
jgi:hypothetical protein